MRRMSAYRKIDEGSENPLFDEAYFPLLIGHRRNSRVFSLNLTWLKNPLQRYMTYIAWKANGPHGIRMGVRMMGAYGRAHLGKEGKTKLTSKNLFEKFSFATISTLSQMSVTYFSKKPTKIKVPKFRHVKFFPTTSHRVEEYSQKTNVRVKEKKSQMSFSEHP